MKVFFNIDSPLWKFMDFLGDMVILNLLFILTSIPLVTIGASITAMNTVLFRRKDEGSVAIRQVYFSAFKSSFKDSTIIWILYVIFALGCVLNLNAGFLSKAILVVMGVIFAIVTMTMLYSFAMLARFDNTLVDTIMKAFMIMTAGIGYSIVILLVGTALVILTIQSYMHIFVMFSIWVLFGFSLYGYMCAVFYLRVFRRFTSKEDLERIEELKKD